MVWVTHIDATPLKVNVYRKIPPMQYLAYVEAAAPMHFLGKLDTESHPSFARQTAIGATIGGTTREVEIILELMENGMNICRINVSHRSHAYHAETIKNIRKAERLYRHKTGQPFSIAIALDTKGPEIRTGFKEPGLAELELKTGNLVKVTSDSAYKYKCTNQVIYVNDPNFHELCYRGLVIMIDDGRASLQCISIEGVCVTCKVLNDCVISDCRIVTIPNSSQDKPSISDADKSDFKFAIRQRVDILLASFTHSRAAILDIKKYLEKRQGGYMKVVAKIEDLDGFNHIDEIIDAADGVLIGKGDFGVQSFIEKFFLIQKKISSHCNKIGKPVICTRELWESITQGSKRPTRAEVMDIGNSIHDGIDCFLFARENINGQYPPETIRFLSLACREAEATLWHSRLLRDFKEHEHPPKNPLETIAWSVVKASLKGNASAIIVLSECGTSAHIVSRYRPRCPILAVTRSEITGRQSHLYRGIIPLVYTAPEFQDSFKNVEKRIQFAIFHGRKFGFIEKNDLVYVVYEWNTKTGLANNFRTLHIQEEIDCVGNVLYVY